MALFAAACDLDTFSSFFWAGCLFGALVMLAFAERNHK